LAVQPSPCNFCQRSIFWLTTARGQRMPVDIRPHDEGNVDIDRHAGTCGVLNPTAAAGARKAGRLLYRHHKLSCPHADKWAKKKGR
jgi:hypothetical protein